MKRCTIFSMCVVCLLLAGSVVYVCAQRRPGRPGRQVVDGYQMLAVVHGGNIRQFACDTRTGQLYNLMTRNVGLAQPEHTWETLGPAVSAQHGGGGRTVTRRYRIHAVSHGGNLRHFACDTRTGQLYNLMSRNVGLPQPEYTWEKLGPAISN